LKRKTCNADGCSNPVFGKGYCLRHQYMREDFKPPSFKRTPLKKSTKPILKTSKRRKEQLTEYYLYKEKVAKKGFKEGLQCFISCKEIPRDYDEKKCILFDIHHLLGRQEKKLTEFVLCVPVLRQYHTAYHDWNCERLMDTDWYEGFLIRLRKVSEKAWKKEMYKRVKANIITLEEYLKIT